MSLGKSQSDVKLQWALFIGNPLKLVNANNWQSKGKLYKIFYLWFGGAEAIIPGIS